MSKRLDVLILVEHVVRELEMAVLLKVLLDKKGINSVIDTVKFNKERLPFVYRPKVIIVPWAYGDNEMKVFKYFGQKNLGRSIIINLHHEQITNSDSKDFVVPSGIAKKVYHVCWGGNFYNELLRGGCPESTLLKIGNPRIDFYLKKMKNICHSKEKLSKKFDLDVNKKWILFVANSFHLHTEEQKDLFESYGVDIRGIGKVGIENTYEFLKYSKKLLSERDDVIIIYRPHPSMAHLENDNQKLNDLKRNFSNFKVIFQHSIRDWIVSCDKTVSFHSTTYVEAYAAKKEFGLFRPIKLSEDLDLDIFKDYHLKIKNYSDFEKFILEDTLYEENIEFSKSLSKEVLIEYDSYSTEKLADKILLFLSNFDKYCISYKFNIFEYVRLFHIYIFKSLFNKFSSWSSVLRGFLLKSKDHRLNNLVIHGHDNFSQDDVRKIYEAITKHI
jgi:surface carbohydrate biosynthesis protein